ncbi:TolC family protein [Rickettsiales bacterium LUAb2]
MKKKKTMVGFMLLRGNKLLGNIFLKLILAVGVSLFFASSAYALTINEAIERVVNDSPDLRVILEKREQAIANYQGARADYLPSIYLDYTRTYKKADPISDPAANSWEGYNKFETVLQQRIFDMETLSNITRSSYLVQSQEFENQKLLEALIQLAVTSYFDVIQAEYIMAVNNEYLKEVNDIEKLVYNMKNQGNATLGDVNLVQSRVAEATTNTLSSQANLDKVKMRLAYLLNLVNQDNEATANANTILPVLTNKDFYDLADKMVSFMPISVDELQKEAIRNNVDILLIRSNLCAAGYQLEAQKSRWLPTVNLTVTLHNEQNFTTTDNSKYGKFEIESKYYIYDGGARSAGLKNAESSIRELEYNYDIQVRETRDNSYATFNQLRSLENQRASILKEIEASEQVDRIYKQQFKLGTRNLTDRLDNLQRLVDARTKLISVDYAVLNSRMSVLVLLGQFVQFFGFQNYLDYNNLNLC